MRHFIEFWRCEQQHAGNVIHVTAHSNTHCGSVHLFSRNHFNFNSYELYQHQISLCHYIGVSKCARVCVRVKVLGCWAFFACMWVAYLVIFITHSNGAGERHFHRDSGWQRWWNVCEDAHGIASDTADSRLSFDFCMRMLCEFDKTQTQTNDGRTFRDPFIRFIHS